MKTILIIVTILLISGLSIGHGNQPVYAPKFKYVLTPQMQWEETELDTWGDVITNYQLKENKEVIMNFSFLDQDLTAELKEKGVDKVVAGMMKGKEYIYSMMGATQSGITSKKLTTLKDYQLLEINSQYSIKDKTFFLTEKYHIKPNKILLTSFRYSTTNELIAMNAKKDFESVQVKLE